MLALPPVQRKSRILWGKYRWPRSVMGNCVFVWGPQMGKYAWLPKSGQQLAGTYSSDAAGKNVYNHRTRLVENFRQNTMPITGAQEPAITNRCLQSQTLGTTWVPSNVTVGDNETGAPDGTTTADSLTATAANGTLIQDCGVLGSAAYTFSIWLKRKTGTGNIDLTLDNGSTWTTKAITSEWVRYSITQTLANPDCGIRIVTDTDAIYAWGGQVEANAFPTSYIPTTTAAVARSADVFRFNNSALFGPLNGNGSMLVCFSAPFVLSANNGQRIISLMENTGVFGNEYVIRTNSATVGTLFYNVVGGTTNFSISSAASDPTAGSIHCALGTFNSSVAEQYFDGVLSGSDSSFSQAPAFSGIEIGGDWASGTRGGCSNYLIALFDRVLTAAEAKALTLNPERYAYTPY